MSNKLDPTKKIKIMERLEYNPNKSMFNSTTSFLCNDNQNPKLVDIPYNNPYYGLHHTILQNKEYLHQVQTDAELATRRVNLCIQFKIEVENCMRIMIKNISDHIYSLFHSNDIYIEDIYSHYIAYLMDILHKDMYMVFDLLNYDPNQININTFNDFANTFTSIYCMVLERSIYSDDWFSEDKNIEKIKLYQNALPSIIVMIKNEFLQMYKYLIHTAIIYLNAGDVEVSDTVQQEPQIKLIPNTNDENIKEENSEEDTNMKKKIAMGILQGILNGMEK